MNSFICRFFISALIFIGAQGFALEPEHMGGPIHEAFVTPVKGAVIYEAIAKEPPQRITERIPTAPGDEEEWIPGYFAWSKTKSDFVWVCGVWRKPPPGLLWNPGYWTNLDEGWVWIPGFWHNQPAQNLHYIKKTPPAAINENVGTPPKKDMFWAMGHWDYSRSRNSYQWRGGQWESLDSKWVFTPATYTWRPDGYFFVPAYWDWPLDERGSAYCTIFLDPNQRSGVIHTPSVILEPEVIIRTLFVCWPDYISCFHHWWHFHPGAWGGWCCTPPWWDWGGWWWFDWFSAWDLWWWWGNPGFPFPWWLAAALADMIPPPPQAIFPLMADMPPPPIIGPNGMLPPNDLIDAIGGDRPILPADPQEREDIIDRVKPPTSDNGDLRPNGRPEGTAPPPPEVDRGDVEQGPPQTIPPTPETPSHRPPIRPVPVPPSYQPTTPRPFYPQPPVRRPETETPRPRWPRPETPRPFYPPQHERPQQHRPRPEYRPPHQTPRWPRPEFRPPSQTRPPSHGPSTHTPTYPPQQSTPMIRPEFQPRQMTPQFRPQTRTPQTTPQSDMYR